MKKKPQTVDRLSRPPLARMLRIHERLKGDQFPNCSQLSLDLEVATKTVQRDIDFMRDRMNLPIEFDFRRNGFHYTAKVENFPTVQVTEQELVALFVAEKVLAQYKGTPFEKPLHTAFQKLTGGLKDTMSFQWSDLDSAISFRSIGATVADLQLFETVSRAVLRSQELEFQYRKLGELQTRATTGSALPLGVHREPVVSVCLRPGSPADAHVCVGTDEGCPFHKQAVQSSGRFLDHETVGGQLRCVQ